MCIMIVDSTIWDYEALQDFKYGVFVVSPC
jgi:hypothetical protein